ncbi:DMT family transporter [Rhabdobacter roseus]|uniref:Drug/metabolite transporter (DMT)-like permease n=1 Tax=Rhabdobacter roseus TaxID=1655419 RepID=A0A840TP47_9BACT|nr:DMT family transporter [Rhabdobacter roseus]MBB5284695.1 drug/metabolite transporter (DMT)-like permease [Rhabdobacter roseus]
MSSKSITSSNAPIPLIAWGLLGLLALVWGSSFILIKKSLLAYSVTEVAAGRVFLAFVFFFPVLVRSYKIIPRFLLKYLFLSGLLGYLVPAFLIAEAGSHLNSALVGTLNALSPLFTMLIGVLLFGQRSRLMQVVGLLVALGGALMLILTHNGTSFSVINPYVILAIAATLCYGTNINIVARYLRELPPLISTAWIFAGVGPMALGMLLYTGFFTKMSNPANLVPSSALLSLGVLASGLMSVIFNRVIQLSSAVFAASVTYLMPIVALSWGLLDQESIGPQQWGGTFVILAGVYLINRKAKSRPPSTPEPNHKP